MNDLKDNYNLKDIDIRTNISDFAGIIEGDHIAKIDRVIGNIESRTSMEIAVVTTNSLKGEPIDSVAYQLFNKFGLGKKDKNNGILFLISKEDNQFRIEIGLGLEEIIDDSLRRKLISKIISPNFKKKNFGKAILKFVRVIAKKVSQSRFSTLANISFITGIIAIFIGILELVLSTTAILKGYIDIWQPFSLKIFSIVSGPAAVLATIAVCCGIIDMALVKAKDIETRQLSRSITGTALGFLAMAIVLAAFFYFPYLINFFADIFSLSTGSY